MSTVLPDAQLTLQTAVAPERSSRQQPHIMKLSLFTCFRPAARLDTASKLRGRVVGLTLCDTQCQFQFILKC